MKADIGFFQEQQPNGKISNSLMRALVMIPMVFAAIYLLTSLYTYNIEINTLLSYLHDKIISQESYIAMRNSLKPLDWIILGSLITLALGGKVFQKAQENKAITDEIKDTPTEVKLAQVKVEEIKAEKLPDKSATG